MTESLVFLIEPDAARRDALLALAACVPGVAPEAFATLAETRRAMRTTLPHLMIGPWAEGGETLLAARASAAGNGAMNPVPLALILTGTVSPPLISMTRQAGNAELIPCDPLDEDALLNRMTLLLRGADALYCTLDEGRRTALDTALENLPALRRRLAA